MALKLQSTRCAAKAKQQSQLVGCRPNAAAVCSTTCKPALAGAWRVKQPKGAVETHSTTTRLTAPPARVIDTNHNSKTQPKDDSQSDKFDWYRSWYPVAAMSALKSDKPNAVQLLNMNLVVWKDTEGTWRCFEDLCPHRLAPLSEGRIHESGHLQCTYHGWQFDASGSCTNIPQIGDDKAHATACSSPRACVETYPVQVLQDMLWVFADSSVEGWIAARTENDGKPTSMITELADGWSLKSITWYQRDLPMGFDLMMENMTDPAHVPQSHHGVIGDRNSNQHMEMKLADTGITKAGFKVFATDAKEDFIVEYLSPCLSRFTFKTDSILVLYSVPTVKGWCRSYFGIVRPTDSGFGGPDTEHLPPLLLVIAEFVIKKLPGVAAVLQHTLNLNPITDGDSYFMHYAACLRTGVLPAAETQERVLYGGGGSSSWSRQYYMPATADAAVMAWRKWLDRFGSSLPTLPVSSSDLPPLMTKTQVFDRYNQHTKHCPHCAAALKNLTLAAAVAAVVGAVAAGTAVVTVAQSLAPGATGPAVGGGLAVGATALAMVAGAVLAGLLKFRQLFIFQDYVHADHV